jgi:two-component system, cell cycle sensor histidine kinase and response regulator CckA
MVRVPILVIDDKKGFVEVCSGMVKNLGFNMLTAMSGDATMTILKGDDKAIDLIVLDMVIPKMDGNGTFEAIQILNLDSEILIASGYTNEDAVEEMIEKGYAGFLSKPFNISTLSEKLKLVFKDLEMV